MPFRKTGYPGWYLRVTHGRASRIQGLGTTSRATANAMEAWYKAQVRDRDWRLVDGVLAKRFTFAEAFDNRHRADAFLREADDVDLSPLVTDWGAHVNAKYVMQVRSLIAEGQRFPRSTFTRKRVSEFLAGLDVSGATRNRYRAALSVFARWLVEREVLEHNPVRDVKGYKESAPREYWLTWGEAQSVCDAAPAPYRALFAVLYGGGVEISAALRLRAADIDLPARTVRATGTKTAWRTRVAVLEPWAAARIDLRGLLPSAEPFAGITNRAAFLAHRAALAAVKIALPLTLHDARHTYAVNCLMEGRELEPIYRNLGHKDATLLLRVYGKYRKSASNPASTIHVEREVTRAKS